MNTKFLSLLLSCILAASCSAFVVTKTTSKATTTSLQNFLGGRGNKITSRSDEDDAMWFEPPKVKKLSVGEIKAKKAGVVAKKVVAAKKPVVAKKVVAAKKPVVAKKVVAGKKVVAKKGAAAKAAPKAAFKFPWQN